MDNNYEQQFTQSLQAAPASAGVTTNSKLPLIVAAILAAVTLVESIALVISLTNQSNLATEEEDISYVDDSDYSAADYVYDDEDNLSAVNLNCKNENGAYYKLTTDKNYQQYDASNQMVGSGTYSIVRDSIIPLSSSNGNGSEHVLFYDGVILADGTTVYDCTITETLEAETESVNE